jgi:hypothetical protein
LSAAESNDAPIDPRPACGSPAYSDVDSVPDAFFTDVSFKGAFGADNWLDGWSILNTRSGFVSTRRNTITCETQYDTLCGDISSNLDLVATKSYFLTCQTFVKDGATLTIPPGTTIFATPADGAGKAPALVIEQGGKIMAEGTENSPITFTALNPEEVSTESIQTDTDSEGMTMLETRGKWGGLIINGRAPITGGTDTVEGLTNVPYGGTDPADDSGVLKYVRVWHGGAKIADDNEINGVTFGGVGSGTVVDHCEVAFNKDDGFEFFGGTVNVKYLSVLFVGDDAFDTDEGYQGKGQFLFTMLGTTGNHGTEMDSKTGGNLNSQPRSHPQFYGMTIIGGGTAGRTGGLLRLREGSGGKFGNIVMSSPTDVGFRNGDCGTESRVATLPASTVSIGSAADGASSGYLYFSSNFAIGVVGPNMVSGTLE